MPLHRHTMTMHGVGTSPRTRSTLPIRGVIFIGQFAPIALIIFGILAGLIGQTKIFGRRLDMMRLPLN